MKVGIIGGGATGLAAAYELGLHGHEVVVFERTGFLGGQASTFDVGGGRLERGYHHLFTGDRAILDLMEEIGLERPHTALRLEGRHPARMAGYTTS